MPSRAPSEPTLASLQVKEYLDTSEGKRLVSTHLRNRRLSATLTDDLRAMVLLSAAQMDVKGAALGSVGAFTNRTLQRRATDLCRGEIRRRRFAAPLGRDRDDSDESDSASKGDEFGSTKMPESALAVSPSSELRRRLCRGSVSIDGKQMQPWQLSASLTYLSVRAQGLTEGEGRIPIHPDKNGYRHSLHVGLWYAGHRDCFAADGTDSDTIRTRRARRVRSLQDLISLLPALAAEETA